MFLRQRLTKDRCLTCKKRKKKCELAGDKCIYCLKKGIPCKFESIRSSRYADASKQAVFKNKYGQLNGLENNAITCVGIPKIFLPIKTMVMSEGSPVLHEESQLIEVYNDEVVINNSFSLFDFILSGSRIGHLESGICDVEKLRSDITKNNSTARLDHAIELFTSCNTWAIYQEGSDSTTATIPTTSISLDDIDLEIDVGKLQNVLFIAHAAVTDEANVKSFANLPNYISKSLADKLFKHFCKLFNEKNRNENNKVCFLKVCLPLIFGNISVLKCVLLLSYYNMIAHGENEIEILEMNKQMYSLHIEVLGELKERLKYYSSVCCDHSFLFVLLLLNIELINGARGKLWVRLQKLALDMIALKGGVEQMATTLTGLCLMKLLSINLSSGLSFHNLQSDIGQALSLKDWFFFINHKNELDFYDSFNCRSSLGLHELKNVVQIYGHIAILNSMMVVSLGANVKTRISMSEIVSNYQNIGRTNLEFVLNEAERLERDVEFFNGKSTNMHTSPCHTLQITFSLLASRLYLFQVIYKQTSNSPKTVLLVKELLEQVEKVFGLFDVLSDDEINDTTLLILPIFCLGVDLIYREVRDWYIAKLSKLYERTKRQMVRTSMALLEKVWLLNKNGNSCVDWIDVCDSNSSYISLIC